MDNETKILLTKIADYLNSIYGKFDTDSDRWAPDDCYAMEKEIRDYLEKHHHSAGV